MRFLCLVPLTAALAACGGEVVEEKKKAADALDPGQYEITETVTDFRQADEGRPSLDMPKDSTATRTACLPQGSPTNPELFAPEGMTCTTSGSTYVRGGTINATFNCRAPNVSGEIGSSISGSFKPDSFEAQRRLTTALSGEGDVVVVSRLEGRRTGACAAPVEDASAAAPAKAK